MQHGINNHRILFDIIIDHIREPFGHHTVKPEMLSMDTCIVLEGIKIGNDTVIEVGAQTEALMFVKRLRGVDVGLRIIGKM